MAEADNNHSDYSGKWKVFEVENVEPFLTLMGVGWLTRKAISKLASTFPPTLEVTVDGNTITVVTYTKKDTKTDIFKIGEETEGVSMNGAKLKRFTSWDGNKLIVKITHDDPKLPDIESTWSLEGNIFTQENHCKDVKFVRKLQKQVP